MRSVLRVASLVMAKANSGAGSSYGFITDQLNDKVFNMRDNTTGVNIDFVSYAAYAQAGFDAAALLDPEVLLEKSQIVFSTFFQHFVNSNITQQDSGFVYQPAGLDMRINPPMNVTPIQYTPSGAIAPKFEDISRNTSQTTSAILSTRVEVLHMNTIAFWISASILTQLAITIVVFLSVKHRHYSGMMRNVECIADLLVLIAGSERLLAAIQEKGIDTIIEEDRIFTRLGWFRDPDGTMRWRIELVDDVQAQAQPIRLSAKYTPVSGDDEDGTDNPASSSTTPPLGQRA